MKNINTVASDVARAFDEYVGILRERLHGSCSPDYCKGFKDGMHALQMEFLKQLPGVYREDEEKVLK